MTVDGPGNTVVECDSVALPPGPDNPHGNAYPNQHPGGDGLPA
jgi:primary-amine oxidase